MSGLALAVTWTQRVGYSYPPRYFPAVVKDRFPRLSQLEVERCVSVYEDAHGEWMRRCDWPAPFSVVANSQEKL